MQMKSIAVLLTVHNRKQSTLRCLKRLFEQKVPSGYSLDVYLTDDGCTDGTPEAVKAEYPQVNIVCGDGTLFWNRGMYAAWEAAEKAKNYDFFLWLNDDTYPYDCMLCELCFAAECTENKAIIVGATQDTVRKRLTYGGRVDNKVVVPDGSLKEVECFNGNIVLVPRTVYQAIGNLDYYYTHSKGDFDYGLRARKARIDIYQVGQVLGECDAHASLDKWCNPKVPLPQRWKALPRPNGMPPKETFHFERIHYGLARATVHFITIYLRCLFPHLWFLRNMKIQKYNQ